MKTARRLLLTLALMPALAFAGCGAEDTAGEAAAEVKGALDAVALAADKTVKAGGVRYEMKGKIGLPGAPGGSFPLTGRGTIDAEAGKGTSTFTLDIPRVGRTTIDQILDGATIYMTSRELRAITGGKKWLRLDLEKFGKAQGVDFGALTSQSAVDPTEVLDYLKSAGEVRQAGTETIRGELSKKYETKLDLAKAIETHRENPAKRSKAEALLEQAGTKELPVTVFVGPGDLVRRMAMRLKPKTTEDGGDEAAFEFTIDYVEFGRSVAVRPPPKSDVMDIADLSAAASGLGG